MQNKLLKEFFTPQELKQMGVDPFAIGDVSSVPRKQTIAPPTLKPKNLSSLLLDYAEQSPIALRVSGGDPLKNFINFAADYVPGLSLEKAKREQDALGQKLALLDLIPGGGLLSTPIKSGKKVLGTVQYNKLYHGSPEKNLKEISISKSKRSEGFMPHISATENPLLAKAFTRGEFGDKPMGEVYEAIGNFNLINLGTKKGKEIWESLGKNPKKALDEGFDGVQLSSHYEDWKQPFYKDVDFSKLKNAKEIQLFKDLKVSKMK